jgi:hypothetical protein
MKYRAARKVGWIWTRTGWKRVPLRARRVKKSEQAPDAQAVNCETGGAESQKDPSSPRLRRAGQTRLGSPTNRRGAGEGSFRKPETPVLRQIRRAWSGKYDELTPPEARP